MRISKPAVTTAAFLLAACVAASGCGGGGDDAELEPPDTVEEVLDRLNIDTAETARLGPDGNPLPEDHAPLGGRRDLQRFAEIGVLGVQVPALAGTDPLSIIKEVPGAGNSYTDTLLYSASDADLPWASIGGSFPASLRDATRGDIDGDGYEELLIIYKESGDRYIRMIIVDDESAAFARSAPIAVAEADAARLAIESGDFDGDGFDDVAAGYTTADAARVVLLVSDGTTVSLTGDAVDLPLALTTTNQFELRMAAGNLDFDLGEELGVVLNERGSGEAVATYAIFDDLARGLAELDSGFVRADVGAATHTAATGDIAFGDIDGDSVPEVVFGGLTNISFGSADDSWGYLVYALDDVPAGLAPLGGHYFEKFFNGLSESGQSLRMDAFFVNTLDVDGDGVDEVQAQQFIYDDMVNAAPWTELFAIPDGEIIYGGGDGTTYFESHNVAMATSDVTQDGREDVIYYNQSQDDIRVWGVDAIDGWGEIVRLDTPYNGGGTPIWPVIVPPNVDDDSVAVSFNGGTHQLVFTEPVVIAALAAAPCNPDWGQDEGACTTSFGYAESSSVSLENAHTITAGVTVGFSQEFSVLGVQVGGVELLANVKTSATLTQGSSYSLTKRVVHTTGPIEDSVLFTTIPMDQYTYTIVSHPNPELIGGEVVVSMPREPIQALVTRDLYNSSVLEDSVKIGDNVFAHVAGDPRSYPTRGERDALLSQFEGLESPEVDVGQGGGNVSVELSVYEETSQGASYGVEFSLDFKATAGALVVGSSVGYGFGHTIGYASGEESSYTGTVSNLDEQHFSSDQYKFGLFTYVYEEGGRQFEVLNYWVTPQAP
jgi:hypothetical protein